MSAVAASPAAKLFKVMVVDDHYLLLEGLKFVLAPHYEVSCVGSLRQLEFSLVSFRPDVLVIDISMPDGDGIATGHRILRKFPSLKLIFLSMHTDPRKVSRATGTGAHAFVSKRSSAGDLLQAVETVLQGGHYRSPVLDFPVPDEDTSAMQLLTDRQIQVLRLVARGFSAKEIATDLNISVRTAEFHRGAIMQRLNMHSTALLTRHAIDLGLI